MRSLFEMDRRFKDRVMIVAEISANHGQNFNRAISLIKTAKECGADAVKFQLYKAETITIDADNRYFRIRHPRWGGQTLFQLYEKAYTPWNWFKRLKKAADDSGILFFATAFDKTAVDFLEELDVPMHKIASFELVDIPLIKYAAKTKKPLVLSTGMGSVSEIRDAVEVVKRQGVKSLTLLKCVSSYPANPEDMNLRTISYMKEKFGCKVGLSDHTLGIGVSIAAAALGAQMIEKHLTLSRKIGTPDSFFSIEPQELKMLVENIRITEKALGKVHYGLTDEEKKSSVFRRSLFVVKDVRKGEYLTEDSVRSIRPGYGIKPKFLKFILGRRAKRAIMRGSPLRMEMVGR